MADEQRKALPSGKTHYILQVIVVREPFTYLFCGAFLALQPSSQPASWLETILIGLSHHVTGLHLLAAMSYYNQGPPTGGYQQPRMYGWLSSSED